VIINLLPSSPNKIFEFWAYNLVNVADKWRGAGDLRGLVIGSFNEVCSLLLDSTHK